MFLPPIPMFPSRYGMSKRRESRPNHRPPDRLLLLSNVEYGDPDRRNLPHGVKHAKRIAAFLGGLGT